MLGITNLHNGMILFILSISSHGFAFGFPKRSHTKGDVLVTYKPMINPVISRRGTPLPTILNRQHMLFIATNEYFKKKLNERFEKRIPVVQMSSLFLGTKRPQMDLFLVDFNCSLPFHVLEVDAPHD